MIFFLTLFLFAVSYHTLSFSLFLIKKEKNKLAAFGVIILFLLNLALPVYMLIYKY